MINTTTRESTVETVPSLLTDLSNTKNALRQSQPALLALTVISFEPWLVAEGRKMLNTVPLRPARVLLRT
jgi:hypothetical protein